MRGKYFWIAVAGIVLWISETAYFGWNDEPINNVEKTLDFLSAILIVWGIIGDILSGIIVHKHTNYHETNNISTKKVEVIGDNQKVNYVFGTTKDETRELLGAKKEK